MSHGFFFECSVCREERAFKFRYLDENNKNVCSMCLHKKGYFTVNRTMTSEEGTKLGKKLMKKGNIPSGHLVITNPNPADDVKIRLTKAWKESGLEPIFKYSTVDIPLVLGRPGTRPRPADSTRVLIIEESKFGFFNLQWLENVLKQKPRIRIVNSNFFTKNEHIRIEVFLEYVDKPPKYTSKPMFRSR